MAMLVTHSLTHLIDVTLAREDAISKLVEVVTVADVDSEKRFDDSLVHLGSWIHSVILDDITGSASYWLKSLAIIRFKWMDGWIY